MNAIPKPAADLLQQTGQLSESVTRPIPGSRKIFVEGSRTDIQVPMREIALTQTPTIFGGEENPPVTVYDTSGPYTDPGARIDLAAGLPALRACWREKTLHDNPSLAGKGFSLPVVTNGLSHGLSIIADMLSDAIGCVGFSWVRRGASMVLGR